MVDPKALFWDGAQADETINCENRIIAPGYIDMQLNGGFGIDFSTAGPQLGKGVRQVAARLLAHGVTAFLPTVITSAADSYRAILPDLVPVAGSADGAAVLGVHLEGPFISPLKTGCHPHEHVIAPDGKPEALRRACGEHLAHVRLVTLAPELPGADMLIAELVSKGIVVSAGHSAASAAQLEKARAAGVRMCTHLFNAMLPFHSEEPGIIGVLGSIAQPAPYFGLIADGVHVHPASLKIAATARPDSVVLVSDAIVAMGLPKGNYAFGDVRIDVVGDDTAYRHGTRTLAGAVVPLDECVRRFRRLCGTSIVRALEAASLHPACALGIESSKGRLDLGCDADFVMLDDELRVVETYIAGACVWSPHPDGRGAVQPPNRRQPKGADQACSATPDAAGAASVAAVTKSSARSSKRKHQ